VDENHNSEQLLTLQFYKSASGWRWRLRAANGKIIGASTEAYRHGKNCVKNFVFLTGYGFNEKFALKTPLSMTIRLQH